MSKRLGTVAVGGTFDELHKGHRALLQKAFKVGEHVLIGLVSDEFVERLGKTHETAPFDQRMEELKTFLKDHGFMDRVEIIPLNNAYGVTLSKDRIEGLVVSRQTEFMADDINKRRVEMRLPPLQVFIVEMVPSQDDWPISTTRIRHGEIDREGRLLRKRQE
jgi:pantetheine-phosphate adenylyltransferase